jgi:hypothetical protein
MEETINGVTTLKYKSNYLYGDYNGVEFYDTGFYGHSNDGIIMYGSIDDTVLFQKGTHIKKWGKLTITILNTTPQTVKWKVKAKYGMRTTAEPKDFTIPTDIILTKQ